MRKILMLTTCVLMSVSARAAFLDHDAPKPISVAEALTLRDDAPVILEGNIQKRQYKDKYLFVDPSGEMTVEIEEEDWMGTDVKPSDKVRLYGEIDKDWFSTEVDVDRVELIQ